MCNVNRRIKRYPLAVTNLLIDKALYDIDGFANLGINKVLYPNNMRHTKGCDYETFLYEYLSFDILVPDLSNYSFDYGHLLLGPRSMWDNVSSAPEYESLLALSHKPYRPCIFLETSC